MWPRSEVIKLLKNRVSAENPCIVEVVCTNISCAPLYTSVFAHIVILDYVHEVIRFRSNAPAAQWVIPTLPAYIPATIKPAFCAYRIYWLSATPQSNIRRCYLHYKYMFSSSLAISGISLFPIKEDENGKSGHINICAWVKGVMVESFKQIDRGLNVLPKAAKFIPPIRTPY